MAGERATSAAEWQRRVRERARRLNIELPQTTVDELATHLDDLFTAAMGDGESEADARARAVRALEESELASLRQRPVDPGRAPYRMQAETIAHASRRGGFSISGAIRVALRQFRQHRAFAFLTILVLGLGAGAATTVFTIVDAVVLRPLPYREPDRLVALWDANYEKGLPRDPISPVTFMDYRELPVFDGAAAWWRPAVNLADPGLDPVRVNTIEVSANLFDVLGVRPQLGAGFPEKGPFFSPNEPIAVISDRLWRARYSADPSIIGRPLSLNGNAYTVVGVMPPNFHYPDDVDVWQRLRWDLRQHSRSAHFMEAVARLAPGKTFEEAQSACEALALRLEREFPNSNKGWATRLVPLLENQLGYYKPALLVLFGAVGLLVVIGCLNVASLMLTRALGREREMAVRVAVGASPRQLVTQLFAESFVLSAAGALVGIAAAVAGLPLVLRLTPIDIPRLTDATVNVRALAAALGLAAATTIFFGLVPALVLLRGQLATGMRAAERGSSRAGRRLYSVLVAVEVAVACALLVSSALLVRTVGRMTNTPTGVHADDVLTTNVQLASANYRDWRVVAETHARIIEAIRQQPGVAAAGGGNFLPLEVGWRVGFRIQGEPPPARSEDEPQAQYHSVSDGYFEALGATLSHGRTFAPSDTLEAPGVVIVNETFARRYLSDRPAIGRIVLTTASGIGPLGANLKRWRPAPAPGQPHQPPPPPTGFEIVGVVKDLRNVPFGQPVEPAVYFTTRQFPFRELILTVRATEPGVATTAVRNALKTAVPGVPMGLAQTWGERFATRTAQSRLLMTILVVFGGLAALLAALGVYGLFSWSVALRKRELAIRLTLGARPSGVAGLVLRQSTVLVAAGVVAGILLLRLAAGALGRVLYEVTPGDLSSTITASALLLGAALVASIPPAVRAMRVDPMEGLRAE